jgi:hypothetical protein
MRRLKVSRRRRRWIEQTWDVLIHRGRRKLVEHERWGLTAVMFLRSWVQRLGVQKLILVQNDDSRGPWSAHFWDQISLLWNINSANTFLMWLSWSYSLRNLCEEKLLQTATRLCVRQSNVKLIRIMHISSTFRVYTHDIMIYDGSHIYWAKTKWLNEWKRVATYQLSCLSWRSDSLQFSEDVTHSGCLDNFERDKFIDILVFACRVWGLSCDATWLNRSIRSELIEAIKVLHLMGTPMNWLCRSFYCELIEQFHLMWIKLTALIEGFHLMWTAWTAWMVVQHGRFNKFISCDWFIIVI